MSFTDVSVCRWKNGGKESSDLDDAASVTSGRSSVRSTGVWSRRPLEAIEQAGGRSRLTQEAIERSVAGSVVSRPTSISEAQTVLHELYVTMQRRQEHQPTALSAAATTIATGGGCSAPLFSPTPASPVTPVVEQLPSHVRDSVVNAFARTLGHTVLTGSRSVGPWAGGSDDAWVPNTQSQAHCGGGIECAGAAAALDGCCGSTRFGLGGVQPRGGLAEPLASHWPHRAARRSCPP